MPLFSPAQPITVLHATRRPLKQLTWSDTALTVNGPTRVRFAATADAHRPSTAGMEILASWDEIIDPGFGPVTTVPRSAVLGSMDVPSDGTEPLAWSKEYDFGDTKRRDLSLSVIGSTRYRDCFPELTEGDPRGQRVLTVPSKIRKNTRRPEPPEIAAIVPTYRWVRSTAGGSSPAPGNEPGSGCGCDDHG